MKKDVEILLSRLEDFSKPNPELEQYRTPSDIAADMLNIAHISGHLEGTVFDLGCGVGTLAIGASLFGAKSAGFDIDRNAVQIAQKNLNLIKNLIGEDMKVKFEVMNILDINKKTDTVVMNPPFGLRGNYTSAEFLEKSFHIAKVVYSLLHSSAKGRGFTEKLSQEHGFKSTLIKTYDFRIPKIFEFHKKNRVFIKVDLWKFEKR
ncbi:MAG: DNA methylase [Candidatus Aenigmatarchaeota archaeon]|nr:MAG: DNA methylase [Candidatus Aenigmarchaeota archaeon]